MRGDPIPWKASDITPNLGASPDTTDDMRGGMGLEGLLKISKFIDEAGFRHHRRQRFDSSRLRFDRRRLHHAARELQVRGSVLNSVVADKKSPSFTAMATTWRFISIKLRCCR